MASEEYLYFNNDNAAVDLSPAKENLRGNLGLIHTSLQRPKKRKKTRKIYVCMLHIRQLITLRG